MSIDNLIIVSAREFGREVYAWAEQSIRAGSPYRFKGFIDENPEALRKFNYGNLVIGSPATYIPDANDAFVVAIGNPTEKRRFVEMLQRRGARFGTLIHPTALIGNNVMIGEGAIIGPLTQLSCDITVGRHVVFGTNSNTAHDTKIGDFCQICGSCELNGGVHLGSEVFVGSHATLVPRVRVGDNAYIGAGSVVLKNVRPQMKVFGNPAVVVGMMGSAEK